MVITVALAISSIASTTAPPILWSISNARLIGHDLHIWTPKGPFSWGPADRISVTGLDNWDMTGSLDPGEWYRQGAYIQGGADPGRLSLRLHGYGQMRTNNGNTWRGGGAEVGQVGIYFRGPGNNVQPRYTLHAVADYSFFARTTHPGMGAVAQGGRNRIEGTGDGVPNYLDFSKKIDLVGSNYIWGPYTVPQYPGVEYWWVSFTAANGDFDLNPDTEVACGIGWPVGFADASAHCQVYAEAWLEEGVPPVTALEGEYRKCIVDQDFAFYAEKPHDPDNGTGYGEGIIAYLWSIDGGPFVEGSFLRDVKFNTRGRHRVALQVVDDEGMRSPVVERTVQVYDLLKK